MNQDVRGSKRRHLLSCWLVAVFGLAIPVRVWAAGTDTPTSTPTPTRTVATPSVTPTSCRGDLPVVEPVLSPTGELQQVIYFCGRIVGASSMSACSEAGCATDIAIGGLCTLPCPNPGNGSCNRGTVPLLAGQTNHLSVCQSNGLCAAGGCVTVDGNGNPLEIVQSGAATPTLTTSDTPTPTATDTPSPTLAATLSCPATPVDSCLSAEKGALRLRDDGDAQHRMLIWKWLGGVMPLQQSDFGYPTDGSTNYAVCVYDFAAGTARLALEAKVGAGGACGASTCWRALSDKGWLYRDAEAANDGFKTIMLRGGTAGRPRVTLMAKGAELPAPAKFDSSQFFAEEPEVVVQMHGSGIERCWTSSFGPEGTRSNDATLFNARTP